MPTASNMPFLTGGQGLESGFKMGSSMLEQMLKRKQFEEQQQKFAQQQALRQAKEDRLAQQARIPHPVSAIGKALYDMQQAKQSGAPDEDVNLYRQYAQRTAEGAPGMQLSVDPSTGAVTFASGGRGVQSSSQKIVDGKVISKPTMATTSQHQQQNLAAIAREEALKHINQPYMGAGASLRMLSDILKYETATDPKVKEEIANKLVDSAVSEKIAPEVGALQLSSQGVRPTVHALAKQERAIRQGWPDFGKRISDMLPAELQDKVVEEHNNRLKELTDVRQKHFVQGFPYNITPQPKESSAKELPTKEESGKEAPVDKKQPDATKTIGGVTYYKRGGAWYKE